MSTRTNFRRSARKIERLAKEQGRALKHGSGLRLIGESVMTDVNASRAGHGVPVDRGVLRSTGRTTGPDSAGTVRLSYGGAAAPYALVQHERLDLRHTVGEARYLVRAVERWEPGQAAAAIAAMRAEAEAATRRAAAG